MIRLSPMRPADLPQVLAIETSAFPRPWSETSFRSELEAQPHARLEVARLGEGGVVAGYICYWLIHEEVRVLNVAVAEECRRRGVGTALLRGALAAGRRAGAREAVLEVRPSNAAALALYHRLGFAPVGRRRGYYADSGEDALLLALPLGLADG